jgi:hypothetical protein
LRWHTGTTEELTTERHLCFRTSPAAVDLARQLGPAMNNKDLAAALSQAGHHTAHGRPFDLDSASNLRRYYNISYPAAASHGELTIPQAAAKIGVSVQTIKYWINRGYLAARQGPARQWAIPFPPDVETACRQRAASSFHQHTDITRQPRADGEYSITETAARLGIKPPRIYTWIKEGILTARRGPGARHWITLTPETEAECRKRIAADTATSHLKPSST